MVAQAAAVALLGVAVVLPASSAAAVVETVAPVGLSRYVAVAPKRILDTREGLGAPKGLPAAGASVGLQVTGRGGVPATGVTAVTLNVVATDARQVGYVQALPSGGGTPGASSNINIYYPGQTAANLVTVPVGTNGGVTLYDVAGAHLVADVMGYFTASTASTDGRYQGLNPTRVVDSRDRTGLPVLTPPPGPTAPANPGNSKNCTDFGTWSAANAWFWTYYPYYGDVASLDGDDNQVPCQGMAGAPSSPVRPPAPPTQPPFDSNPMPVAGESFTVKLTGKGGVPTSGVSSVALTVTATQSSGPGFVQVVPTGGPTVLGTTSNVNLTRAGETVANLVIVPVGADGSVQLFNSSGTHLLMDVVGYFTDTTAALSDVGLFVPLTPGRLMDTRTPSAPAAAGSQTALAPLGKKGIPTDGVAAVFLNPTATQTAGAGFLQLFPTGQGTAGASSSLNFTAAGQTIANAAIGALGSGGTVTIFTPTRTQIVVDAFGYFTGPLASSSDGLAGLIVAEKNTSVAYDRSTWAHWSDDDSDCRDTRAEVLIAEATSTPVMSANGCSVVSGTWSDPYSGQMWNLASDLDVDHMVPLKNAHDSGGWAWDAATKKAYANDLSFADHLIAVEDGLNQSKSDRGPEAWVPPAASYGCTYATDWVTIKSTWHLTVTAAEHDALAVLLATC